MWDFKMILDKRRKDNKPVCVCVSCLVVYDSLQPHDCSPQGPSVHWILQARTLEWVATSFSKRNYRKKESAVSQLCLTLWPRGLHPTSLLHPWNFPGKSTGVGCQFLLLAIDSYNVRTICADWWYLAWWKWKIKRGITIIVFKVLILN